MAAARYAPEPYRPSRAVVLAELAPERRRYVLELLARESSVSTVAEGPDKRVASVRILGPGVVTPVGRSSNSAKQQSGIQRRRELAAKATMGSEAILARVEHMSAGGVDCALYPRFCLVANELGSPCAPRVRPLSWLMRLIEEIYEMRDSATDACFPLFAVEALWARYGIDKIVASKCWDVVCTVNMMRANHLEVEIFGRFLQEVYDADDLAFYLNLRRLVSEACPQCAANNFFRTRWTSTDLVGPDRTPPPVDLSRAQCLAVCAKIARPNTPGYTTLADTVHAHGASLRLPDFLHVVLLAYHDRHLAPEEEHHPRDKQEQQRRQQRRNTRAWAEDTIKHHFKQLLDGLPDDIAAETVAEVARQAGTTAKLDDLRPLVQLLATYAAERLDQSQPQDDYDDF